jgi:tetratricopeptide (TPR) repeat protein
MPGVLREIKEHLSRSEIPKARALISRALGERPTESVRAQLLLYRAKAHLSSNHPEHCLEDLEAVQQLAHELFVTPGTQELLADSLLMRFERSRTGSADRDDLNRAVGIYQSIIDKFPEYGNLGWIHYQLGRAFQAINDIQQAIDCFQKGLNGLSSRSTLKAFCYERLGFIEFFMRREFKRSLGFLEFAVAVYPPEEDTRWLASVHLLTARVLHALGQIDAMVYSLNTAIELASESNQDQTTLADALLSAGELLSTVNWYERETINYLQRYLEISARPESIDVTWSRVHEIVGDMHFRLNEYEAAAKAYTTALQYNPFHPWEVSIHYRAAQSYYQLGEYEAVVTTIKRLLESAQADSLPITDYHVYDILGNAEFALGQYDDAAKHYQTALELAPPSFEGIEKIRLYHHFACQLLDSPH